MSADIPWGHTTTSAVVPPQVLTIMRTHYSGPKGTRWCNVRPSAGDKWTAFETGGEVPDLKAIADDGGISVRFGLKP